MLRKLEKTNITNTFIIVATFILLSGVITMMCGFIHNNPFVVYVGIFATGATSFAIMVQAIIHSRRLS